MHVRQVLSLTSPQPRCCCLLTVMVPPVLALVSPPSPHVSAISHHSRAHCFHGSFPLPSVSLLRLSLLSTAPHCSASTWPRLNGLCNGIYKPFRTFIEHSNGVNSEVCTEMQKENCSFSIMNKVLLPCWASVSLAVK